MANLSDREFSTERMTPKAFAPLQVDSPQKHDPTGRDHIFNDVPYKTRMGRMKPAAWLGETYARSDMSTGGYVRNTLRSTLED